MGISFHDTEEWYKILRKTDLRFENWHEEYGKFSPEQLNVSKLAYWWDPLIQSRKSGSLNSTEKLCHDIEEWCKIWRGIDLSFQNWHKEFNEFWPEYLKVPKIFILMCPFWAKYVLFVLKIYREELPLMKLKRNTKFGEESTCLLKIGIRNLSNFDLSSRKSQRFSL